MIHVKNKTSISTHLELSDLLEKKVKVDDVLPIIHEVTRHYLSYVGRIGIEKV